MAFAANHIRPKGGRTLAEGTDLATRWAYIKHDVKNWAYSLYLYVSVRASGCPAGLSLTLPL